MIPFAQPRSRGLPGDIARSLAGLRRGGAHSGAWLPPVHVQEEGSQFPLKLALPGVEPTTVEITSDEGVRTIRRRPAHPRRGTGRPIERKTGESGRRFRLPELADAHNITAKSINGVLEIAIPKLAREKPRRIAVEAG